MAEAMFSLRGKVALVAGGAGHLGSLVCRGLARQGASVLVVDVAVDRAGALVDDLRTAGVRAEWAEHSLSEQASIDSLIAHTVKCLGRLDILVDLTLSTTAGVSWHELTDVDFDRANRGNLTETFMLARAAARAMQPGGSIVLFSSMYGSVSPDPRVYRAPMLPNPVEYGVGKAGVEQLTRYLATALGPSGVRVNAIAPGPFPNPTVCSEHPDFVARLADRVPLGRVGHPSEIAGPVIMLASDEASFITGQIIAVDGGWTSW